MGKHYYLVASLPPLVLGEAPPITPEEFLAQCEGPLGEGEWMEVRALLRGELCPNARSAGARAWCSKEIQLRNAVARIRATRQHVDPRSFLREHEGFDAGIEKMATDAFARSNPLEVEQALDHGRWRMAEELSLVDPFGMARVMAYAVQLRLAQRWADLDTARGRARLEKGIENETRLDGAGMTPDDEHGKTEERGDKR